jgi:two-component system LytT family response regulator
VIRTLLVDDEELARDRLRRLLAREADVEIAGECASGDAAVRAIASVSPELVFLDVQMPDGGGFEVIDAVGVERMPHVIFVTAYSEHAVRAFEADALDYLVKPVARERLAAAVARVRRRLRLEGGAPSPPALGQRLVARAGPRLRLVAVDDIDYLSADGNYVQLHVGARSYLVRETLASLEARLDPARFLRVHRSTIVRLDRIEEVEPLFQGEYAILLRGGARLTSARSYRARLQQALGL